jgi:integrase
MKRRANSEGSIYQRSNGSWEAKITLPGGKRKSLYAKTQGELMGKLKEAHKRQDAGVEPVPRKITLESYLSKWLEETAKPTVRPYTYQSYAQNIRLHIIPELGRITLTGLTAQHVQGFLNRKRESGLSSHTVQYLHALLRRALGQAERWGMVVRNVARLVSPPAWYEQRFSP